MDFPKELDSTTRYPPLWEVVSDRELTATADPWIVAEALVMGMSTESTASPLRAEYTMTRGTGSPFARTRKASRLLALSTPRKTPAADWPSGVTPGGTSAVQATGSTTTSAGMSANRTVADFRSLPNALNTSRSIRNAPGSELGTTTVS